MGSFFETSRSELSPTHFSQFVSSNSSQNPPSVCVAGCAELTCMAGDGLSTDVRTTPCATLVPISMAREPGPASTRLAPLPDALSQVLGCIANFSSHPCCWPTMVAALALASSLVLRFHFLLGCSCVLPSWALGRLHLCRRFAAQGGVLRNAPLTNVEKALRSESCLRRSGATSEWVRCGSVEG